MKNSIFEIPVVPQTLNINNCRTTSAKSITWISLGSLSNILLKKCWVKAMFTFTTFEIFLFGGRLVLSAAQWGTESERLKISVKNQKTIWLLLKLLEKWLTYKVTRFWMVFNSFWFCFTLSVAEKLKNSIFEIPIILQNLNINNWRTTSAKSINLIIITKLIKYSFKNVRVKAMFTIILLEILLFESRSVLSTRQRGKGS